MNYVGQFFTRFKDFYNDINAATLTGAIDVIIVEQEDGTLLCSPFHVRFGKLGVLRYKGKTVDIRVNGEDVDLTMKLGDSGVAYFVEKQTPSGEDGEVHGTPAMTAELEEVVNRPFRRSASLGSRAPSMSASMESLQARTRGHQRTLSSDSDVSFKSLLTTGTGHGAELLSSLSLEVRGLAAGGHSSLCHSYSLPKGRRDRSGISNSLSASDSRIDMVGSSSSRGKQRSASSYCCLQCLPVSASHEHARGRSGHRGKAKPRSASLSSSESPPGTPRKPAVMMEQHYSPYPFSDDGAAPAKRRSLNLEPGMEGLHSLSDSELCHDGAQLKPGEQQLSWPWGRLPTTQTEMAIKTKGEATPTNASSTRQTTQSRSPLTEEKPSSASTPTQPEEAKQELASVAEQESASTTPLKPAGSSSLMSMVVSRLWSSGADGKSEVTKPKDGGMYLSDLNTENLDPSIESLYFQQKAGDHARTASLPEALPTPAPVPDVKSDSEAGRPQPAFELLSSSAPLPVPSSDAMQRIRGDTCSDSGASSMPGSPPPGDSHPLFHSHPPGRIKSASQSSDGTSPLEAHDRRPECADTLKMLSTPNYVEFSNCAGLKDSEKMPDRFAEYRVSYDDFCNKPELLNYSTLVVRIDNRYYTWQAAAPIIMSMMVFGKSLPERTHHNLMKQHMPRKRRFMWFWRGEEPPSSTVSRSGSEISATANAIEPTSIGDGRLLYHSGFSSDDDIGGTDEVAVGTDDEGVPTPRALTSAGGSVTQSGSESKDTVDAAAAAFQHSQSLPAGSGASDQSRSGSLDQKQRSSDPWRETLKLKEKCQTDVCTLRLSSDELKKLKLKRGMNVFTFSVTTKYQGTSACDACVYLWHHKDRVVVSDIDGTITRSDVYGQVLPWFGQDWAQSGVAELFTGIEKNDYRFIYLSARAIGQSKLTRDYLRNIRQGAVALPNGPLLLNPSSLVHAFHREVIMKNPEEFKIAALKDVGSLFTSEKGGPYYAGFGNRMTDVITYIEVGIPNTRIFTINPRGELRQEFMRTFKSSYNGLIDLKDQFFPPLDEVDSAAPVSFNHFNYWRVPLPVLDDEPSKDK